MEFWPLLPAEYSFIAHTDHKKMGQGSKINIDNKPAVEIHRGNFLKYNGDFYCQLDSERKGRYVDLLFHGLEV